MDFHEMNDIKAIIETMQYMIQMEESVGALYEACADTWLIDSDFWGDLAREERKHREYLERMSGIISEKPGQFEKGRIFSMQAIKTSISGIMANLEKIKKGEVQEKTALAIARDIEQSMIESRYNEIVKTDDLEYRTLMQKVVGETAIHRTKIEKKMQG